MSLQAKTLRIIEVAVEVLTELHPMTVRQVYYQLVSRQVIKNNRCQYQAVSKALVAARQDGTMPWEWIEDRTRQPRMFSMWEGLTDFAKDAAASYRRDVWADQSSLVEVWLEKDALSGIFVEALGPYGVTLNVGRGYDGWDSIHNAAERYEPYIDGANVTVLYFGDFDPSGEDMLRSLRERLAFFGCEPEITKCALTAADVEAYDLPPEPAKKSDTRRDAFVAEHGDVSVEIDALPVDVLRERLVSEVAARMDLDALKESNAETVKERKKLRAMLNGGAA